MSKNLPRIYKNIIENNIGNNNDTFYSFKAKKEIIKNEDIKKEKDVAENIEQYLNKKVEIITDEFTIITKITSKLNNHILTSDNKKIVLSDIKRINLK